MHPLSELFREVDITYWENTNDKLDDFILRAITFHKVDVSQYKLSCDRKKFGITTCVEYNEKILNFWPYNWATKYGDKWYKWALQFEVLHELFHIVDLNEGRFRFSVRPDGGGKVFWVTKAQSFSFEMLEIHQMMLNITWLYNSLPMEASANLQALKSPLLSEGPEAYILILWDCIKRSKIWIETHSIDVRESTSTSHQMA